MRQHIGVHRHQRREHDEGEGQVRLGDAPDIGAAGREHDQLGIAVQPVERMQAGDEQRNRRHDCDQIGHGKRSHGEEHHHALPLIGDERDFPKRGGHPDDQRQRDQDHRQGAGRLAEDVAADDVHMRRKVTLKGPHSEGTDSERCHGKMAYFRHGARPRPRCIAANVV